MKNRLWRGEGEKWKIGRTWFFLGMCLNGPPLEKTDIFPLPETLIKLCEITMNCYVQAELWGKKMRAADSIILGYGQLSVIVSLDQGPAWPIENGYEQTVWLSTDISGRIMTRNMGRPRARIQRESQLLPYLIAIREQQLFSHIRAKTLFRQPNAITMSIRSFGKRASIIRSFLTYRVEQGNVGRKGFDVCLLHVQPIARCLALV